VGVAIHQPRNRGGHAEAPAVVGSSK
jgi:hypothetical protein